jgi:hypothetical protein
MKQVSFCLNILLVIAVFYACSKNSGSTNSNCSFCKENPNVIAANTVNTVTAKEITRRYQLDDQPKLQIGGGAPDAASVWFSLETLKAFICQIETSTCNGTCRANNLGIRFYYCKYPKDMNTYTDLNGLPPTYVEHHTLMLVPTFSYDGENSIHRDFDLLHLGDNICKPTPLVKDSIPQKTLFVLLPGVSDENHGDLIPPYLPKGTAF